MAVDRLLMESVVVGLLVLAVGTVVSFGVGALFSVDLPAVCRKWNKNHIMELCLFLTGFVAHLLCEVTGVNKWYCKNGNACSK